MASNAFYELLNSGTIDGLEPEAIAGTSLVISGNGTIGGTLGVTGVITGDVTGDLTGNVTGNVTGDVTGNLTGNVTGTVNGAVSSEVVTATNVITAAESGKTFFLNAAAGFTSTLPAPALGLSFTFIVKATATSNGYTITTNGGADIIYGVQVVAADGAAADTASADDTVVFAATNALPGDRAHFVSDGTNWYMTAATAAVNALTISAT